MYTPFFSDWSPLRRAAVESYSSFLISSHVRPDGDAIGSELGIAALLRNFGCQTKIVNVSQTPRQLQFLDPKGEKIQYWQQEFDSDRWFGQFDAIMLVDTSSYSQLDLMATPLRNSGLPIIIIDHHAIGDLNDGLIFRAAGADSTGSLICEAFQALGQEPDQETALALFTALCTDTGWFRFQAVTEKTFRTAAWLTAHGARPDLLYKQLFEKYTFARIKVSGVVLDNACISLDGRCCWSWITSRDFVQFHADHSDLENIVNELLTVDGVEVAVLVSELREGTNPPVLKVNLRSRSDQINVAEIARQYGGGGHKQAAGATIPGDEADIQPLITDIRQLINRTEK